MATQDIFVIYESPYVKTTARRDGKWIRFYRETMGASGRGRDTLTAELSLAQIPDFTKWLQAQIEGGK